MVHTSGALRRGKLMTVDPKLGPAAGGPGATVSAQPDMTPPRHPLTKLALFLDLDGTLAPIANTPNQACVPSTTLVLLRHLHNACNGAVAIISGRDAPDIDRMLSPLTLPCAALHGAHVRNTQGQVKRVAIDHDALTGIASALARDAASMPGTLLERKALSVAFHYRNAPHLAAQVQASVLRALAHHGHSFDLQKGKMVVEIKPRGVSKGTAVSAFMSTPPFSGRMALMAGDDLTDESAFAAVNAMDGITIKIGGGPTQARSRLPNPEALRAWLASLPSA
ncbi:trehalose-phosphatase [Pollutimonas thiosulfatoxidans]|nr:trehalose-phosphatase [Pollutimonas thiosulfatoxidans]MBF6618093.1 trehalose-phosphatase [Candidimonas sp.]